MPSLRLLEHLKKQEGCRLEVYPDQVGLPTIGYGHLLPSFDYEPITQEKADQMLADDAAKAEKKALALAPNLKDHPGPLDALTDLVFNVGAGALQGTKTVQFLREGRWAEAKARYLLWGKARAPNGVLVELDVLKHRRAIAAKWIEEG